MKITYDIDKLTKLLEDFYICTKLTITLFDSDLKCIASAGEPQAYCNAIRTTSPLWKQCDCSDRDNAYKSRDTNSTVVYTCHAGLIESVTPIFDGNSLIAYLMIGKFRDTEKELTSPNKVCQISDMYDLDKQIMLQYYNDIPIFTKQYIDSAVSIIGAIISHMSMYNYIRYQRSEMASEINQYIDEHLDDEITVNDLCDKFHVARGTLFAIFKLEYNDSVGKHILKKRLEKAQNLLSTTNTPIKDIAVSVGFNDHNYFARIFKKHIGLTPIQYRHNVSNSTRNNGKH